jgi:hypothetical protein
MCVLAEEGPYKPEEPSNNNDEPEAEKEEEKKSKPFIFCD